MEVSIVIPAYNEEENIEKCIKSIQKQNYPKNKYEIIMVDDNSKDKTSEIAHRLGVKVIRNKRNMGIAETMNRGIRASRGKYVITFHSDAEMIGKSWIKNMLKVLESDEKIGVVTSDRVPIFKKNISQIEKVHLYFAGAYSNINTKTPVNISWLPTRCDVFKRELIKKVGLFNKKYRSSGEDIDMSTRIMKAGYKIVFNPTCTTRVDLSGFQNNLYKILRKRILFGKVIPSLLLTHRENLIKNKMWLATTVPYVAYFLLLLSSLFNPMLFPIFLLVNFILSVRISKIIGIASLPIAFLLLPLYIVPWNIGIIYGLFLTNKKII